MAQVRLIEPNPAEVPLRRQLMHRRARLSQAPALSHPDLALLLREVDDALQRLDGGSWGLCERCHDAVESERLLSDPLVRVCLDCMSPDEARALERDLQLASAIQAALLPARRVTRSGWDVAYRYLPLGAVSGDHCDVQFPEDDGALHFVIGDVSGKGVSAALIMSHLQAALRAFSGMRLPLEALVARANRLLCESTVASSYATLIAGRLHADGTLELCNAGHCAPILARETGASTLPATGLPLGLLASARYDVHRLRLRETDSLFLYTDGLSETTGGDGREIGSQVVADWIRPRRGDDVERLLDGVLEREASHRGATSRQDDLTMMAIRRLE